MKINKKIVDLLYLVSLQLFIVFVLFLFLDSFNIVDVSLYLYLELLFIVSLLFFGVSFALKYEGNLVLKKYLPYLFLFSLLIFVVHEFYPLGFVDSWKYYLMSLSVFLGALSFWFNREVIDVVEEESNEEKLEEDKREKEFGKKFPFFERFNISYRIVSNSGLWKILFVLLSPLIFIYRLPYSFVKWCYKEGWWYSVLIIVIFMISFSFMNYQLEEFLTVDEPRWISTVDTKIVTTSNYSEAMQHNFYSKTYGRSASYWDSYLSGDLKETFNNPNPSATLNFLHLPGYFLEDSLNFNDYLKLNRLVIIFHNLFLLFFIYYILKKIYNKDKAFLSYVSISLFPLFIGFSRIINHDSIQGLYIILFILLFWLSLKKLDRKYFLLSGFFFSLSISTQYKSEFLIPLIFLLPILYLIIEKKIDRIYFVINNLTMFYFIASITFVLLVPSSLFFPEIALERLFFYTDKIVLLAIIFSIFIFTVISYFKEKSLKIIEVILYFEKYIIRMLIIFFILLILYSLINYINVFNEIFYSTSIQNFLPALISSINIFVFSTPVIFLLLFMIWSIHVIYKPKITFSNILILLFLSLLILGTLETYRLDSNSIYIFSILGTKYIYVFIFMFIIGLMTSEIIDAILYKRYIKNIIISFILSSLIISNLLFMPFYIHNNNFLLPEGHLVTSTVWGLSNSETSNYINGNFKNKLFYDPNGRIKYLLKNNNTIIPWHNKFWEENPDYIIVDWEKAHKYTDIFDYYRENETPIWHIKRNGVIYTGIYKFNPNLNYTNFIK